MSYIDFQIVTVTHFIPLIYYLELQGVIIDINDIVTVTQNIFFFKLTIIYIKYTKLIHNIIFDNYMPKSTRLSLDVTVTHIYRCSL